MRDAQVVKLRSKTAGRTTVNNAAWISSLGNVVSNCFDCCYYTQHDREGMSYVFYGVVTNAECAVNPPKNVSHPFRMALCDRSCTSPPLQNGPM